MFLMQPFCITEKFLEMLKLLGKSVSIRGNAVADTSITGELTAPNCFLKRGRGQQRFCRIWVMFLLFSLMT